MPRGIAPEDWRVVHQLACDIVNATFAEDDVLTESKTREILNKLNELITKYGNHPTLLATKADYMDQDEERLLLYKCALGIAREWDYKKEVEEILDSIEQTKQSKLG